MWESSLCSFHTGFLLSPLTFPVPGGDASFLQISSFVFTSLAGVAPPVFPSQVPVAARPKLSV